MSKTPLQVTLEDIAKLLERAKRQAEASGDTETMDRVIRAARMLK